MLQPPQEQVRAPPSTCCRVAVVGQPGSRSASEASTSAARRRGDVLGQRGEQRPAGAQVRRARTLGEARLPVDGPVGEAAQPLRRRGPAARRRAVLGGAG